MTTRIKIKKGAGTPSGLTFGELAYDLTNKKLFIGITGGNALLANTDGGVASFNGLTLTAGEDDPTTNPDLALTTTEFFDPGIKLVSVYLVVTTDTNKASLTKTSYAFAPTTGFQDKSADTYPTLLVTNPVTSSLLTVKVRIDDQIFGDRYFLILTV